MNNLALVGHNNPPGPIELAETVASEINAWLGDHPVIETEEQARAAKPLLDRAKAACDEIEAERDGKVRPLNERVASINAQYKGVHNTDQKKPGKFDRIILELKARIAAYLRAEEDRRQQEAEEARRKAEEAELIAREAEQREREALANAQAGELDVDVAAVISQADTAFAEYEQQSRFAARAERDSKAKIGGGFRRTAALRTVETLHLDSYGKALKAIGPHPKIEEAILSVAREYRKTHGALPDGVRATTERAL